MTTESSPLQGTLYIVATPIGNFDDITLRALSVLSSVDIVVCEERKVAERLLHQYGIDKELIELNEHNDNESTLNCLKLLSAGRKLALISDAGTPLIADPGEILVATALKYGYPVEVVPGPSSIITALVRSGLPIRQFLFVGFLSRKKQERERQIKFLAKEPRTLVIIDTPYRLVTVLEAMARVMPDRRAYVGCNLTMAAEAHHYGTLSQISEYLKENRTRSEFVLVVEGNHDWQQWIAELFEKPSQTQVGYAINGASLAHIPPSAHIAPAEQNPPLHSQQDHSTTLAETQRPAHTHSKRYHYRGCPRTRRHSTRTNQRKFRRHHHPEQLSNRYDYEQPVINYTMSNPYQQITHRDHEHPHSRSSKKKRWRR